MQTQADGNSYHRDPRCDGTRTAWSRSPHLYCAGPKGMQRAVILGIPRGFAPDQAERQLPDVAAARALLGAQAPIDVLLAERALAWSSLLDAPGTALFTRTADAVRLACARLALRHGRLGSDFHAYHNEGHVLEICGDRIDRLVANQGLARVTLRDGCALMLFAAGHDLRQREAPHLYAGVGANERASIEETQRILDAAGFSRTHDADLYLALELMIAGSTFDARPPPGGYLYNAADLVQSGGALAAKLDLALDAYRPGWRSDPAIAHGHELALLAADLDTANVSEPFATFARTAENLCREREMLAGRSLAAGESALPVLGFLTDGQERFFFELHRFHSEPGRATFEAGKQANAPRLRALAAGLRARFAQRGAPETGEQVIAAYRATLAELLARG